MKIRWSNFPVPETYVAAGVVAALLHLFVPRPIARPTKVGIVAGAVLTVGGLALAGWAVVAAGQNDIEHPSRLVTDGPFRFSRNPMYLGWTTLLWGKALLANSLWIAIAGGAAWLYTHLVTIPAEERFLQNEFGLSYDDYRKRVRRYL